METSATGAVREAYFNKLPYLCTRESVGYEIFHFCDAAFSQGRLFEIFLRSVFELDLSTLILFSFLESKRLTVGRTWFCRGRRMSDSVLHFTECPNFNSYILN